MKMYAMICKEIEVPEKFEALINYENDDFANYKLHAELCNYVVEKVGLPLAGNAENDTEEWIESVLDEHWHIIVES
jgi:hypothetical protein